MAVHRIGKYGGDRFSYVERWSVNSLFRENGVTILHIRRNGETIIHMIPFIWPIRPVKTVFDHCSNSNDVNAFLLYNFNRGILLIYFPDCLTSLKLIILILRTGGPKLKICPAVNQVKIT